MINPEETLSKLRFVRRSLSNLGLSTFILCFFTLSVNAQAQSTYWQSVIWWQIPSQVINLRGMIGAKPSAQPDTIHEVVISSLVTYKEYKVYLENVRKDSGENVFIKRLPDSTMTEPFAYWQYTTADAYDLFPVLGISWENALQYCRWKTLCEQEGDSIEYYYRLPTVAEWLSAVDHLSRINTVTDILTQKYAEWTLNAYDESFLHFPEHPFGSYIYWHKEEDPLVLKRKIAAGNSWKSYNNGSPSGYFLLNRFYYYANRGYEDISFRLVKITLTKKISRSATWKELLSAPAKNNN